MISLPPKGDTAKKLGAYFSPLKTEAQSTPNMTVKVAEGAFWTADNEHMEYIGGATRVIVAPGSDAKWVLITIRSTGMLNVVDGVASSTPTLPVASAYQDELPIAAIFVGDTTTAITSDMIYDLRPMWSIPPDSVSQSQLAGFAPITYVDNSVDLKADETGTDNSDFILNQGGGSINDSGLYIWRNGEVVSDPHVGIKFNELGGSPEGSSPQWEFSNDGSSWTSISGLSPSGYYTKTEILDGQVSVLNALYYTQNELAAGELDSRYYTETESDANFAPISHSHVIGDISGLEDPVLTVNTVTPTSGDITLGTNELNDMVTAGEADKHVLMYRSAWGEYRNDYFRIDDVFDVDASTPTAKDALLYSGSEYVSRAILKTDISDFVETDHVIAIASGGSPEGTPQDVYGVKTFKNGIVVETSLTVTGDNTSIETTQLSVADAQIIINYGEAGPGVGGGGGTAGIRIDRGTDVWAGSPLVLQNADAVIQWDESLQQWEFGTVTNAAPVLTSNHNHTVGDIDNWPSSVTTQLNANNVNEMSDVTYSGLVTGDHLVYQSSEWVNQVFADDVTTELAANNLNTMSDVVYHTGSPTSEPALATGQILLYESGNWENHVADKSIISDFVEADYIHVTGDETKNGNLTINGDFTIGATGGSPVANTTTTINSTQLNIADPLITINYGETATNGAGTWSGIRVDRGAGSPAFDFAQIYWDESSGVWKASTGSANSPSLTVTALSYVGHTHVWASLTDVSTTVTQVNYLSTTTSDIQDQLDSKLNLTGGTMGTNADITFIGGGEVLGLPGAPSANDAAVCKLYVDTLDAASAAALYAHAIDTGSPTVFHMTSEQNTFLDAVMTGSPTVAAAEVNTLQGVDTGTTVQTQLDDKISRSGETGSPLSASVMDSGISLNFSGGGEVIGLPASPSATGASSKEYVDTLDAAMQVQLDAHVDETGSPVVHHMTPEQNTFMDALNITGSPETLTAAHVNFLSNVTSNVQDQLDIKANFVPGSPTVVGNLLKIASDGDMEDSTVAVNDGGVTTADLWTGSYIDTTFAHKVAGSPVAVAGNFAGLAADGDITDSGFTDSSFSLAAHTHANAATAIDDWAAALDTYFTGTAVLDDISDVAVAGPTTGELLRWSGSAWGNVAPANITEFVHREGSIAESITGVKTFSANAVFSSDVQIAGDLTVLGTTTTIDTVNLDVTDKNITVNAGYTGAAAGSTGSGLSIVRGTTGGSPALETDASLVWDETLSNFKAGLVGAETELARVGLTPAQPAYDIQTGQGGSPTTELVYTLTGAEWNIPAPASNHAAIQIFVNGIKQTEGAGKAFVVTSGYGTNTITITFNAGSEPAAGTDVEFYGFGNIG